MKEEFRKVNMTLFFDIRRIAEELANSWITWKGEWKVEKKTVKTDNYVYFQINCKHSFHASQLECYRKNKSVMLPTTVSRLETGEDVVPSTRCINVFYSKKNKSIKMSIQETCYVFESGYLFDEPDKWVRKWNNYPCFHYKNGNVYSMNDLRNVKYFKGTFETGLRLHCINTGRFLGLTWPMYEQIIETLYPNLNWIGNVSFCRSVSLKKLSKCKSYDDYVEMQGMNPNIGINSISYYAAEQIFNTFEYDVASSIIERACSKKIIDLSDKGLFGTNIDVLSMSRELKSLTRKKIDFSFYGMSDEEILNFFSTNEKYIEGVQNNSNIYYNWNETSFEEQTGILNFLLPSYTTKSLRDEVILCIKSNKKYQIYDYTLTNRVNGKVIKVSLFSDYRRLNLKIGQKRINIIKHKKTYKNVKKANHCYSHIINGCV